MQKNPSEERSLIDTISLAVIAVVTVAFALQYTKSIMMPFVLSIFICSLVSPIIDTLVLRLRVPRALAVVFALLVVVFVLSIFVLTLIYSAEKILGNVVTYKTKIVEMAQDALAFLQRHGVAIKQEDILKSLNEKIPSLISSNVGNAVNVAGGVFSFMFLVVIFVIFILAGRNPHVIREGIYAETDTKIRRYLGTKMILSLITGLLVTISLAILGFEFSLAFVFGVLTFLLNFIPNIGSLIATLLPVPIALIISSSPWYIFMVVAVPGSIQMVVGNIVEPKLMGNELELHPVTILLALAFWGLLWGIVGMLLAVPIAAVIRIVLMRFDSTRPIALLMGGVLPKIGAES